MLVISDLVNLFYRIPLFSITIDDSLDKAAHYETHTYICIYLSQVDLFQDSMQKTFKSKS